MGLQRTTVFLLFFIIPLKLKADSCECDGITLTVDGEKTCFEVAEDSGGSWTTADKRCIAKNGFIAHIDDSQLLSDLQDYVKEHASSQLLVGQLLGNAEFSMVALMCPKNSFSSILNQSVVGELFNGNATDNDTCVFLSPGDEKLRYGDCAAKADVLCQIPLESPRRCGIMCDGSTAGTTRTTKGSSASTRSLRDTCSCAGQKLHVDGQATCFEVAGVSGDVSWAAADEQCRRRSGFMAHVRDDDMLSQLKSLVQTNYKNPLMVGHVVGNGEYSLVAYMCPKNSYKSLVDSSIINDTVSGTWATNQSCLFIKNDDYKLHYGKCTQTADVLCEIPLESDSRCGIMRTCGSTVSSLARSTTKASNATSKTRKPSVLLASLGNSLQNSSTNNTSTRNTSIENSSIESKSTNNTSSETKSTNSQSNSHSNNVKNSAVVNEFNEDGSPEAVDANDEGDRDGFSESSVNNNGSNGAGSSGNGGSNGHNESSRPFSDSASDQEQQTGGTSRPLSSNPGTGVSSSPSGASSSPGQNKNLPGSESPDLTSGVSGSPNNQTNSYSSASPAVNSSSSSFTSSPNPSNSGSSSSTSWSEPLNTSPSSPDGQNQTSNSTMPGSNSTDPFADPDYNNPDLINVIIDLDQPHGRCNSRGYSKVGHWCVPWWAWVIVGCAAFLLLILSCVVIAYCCAMASWRRTKNVVYVEEPVVIAPVARPVPPTTVTTVVEQVEIYQSIPGAAPSVIYAVCETVIPGELMVPRPHYAANSLALLSPDPITSRSMSLNVIDEDGNSRNITPAITNENLIAPRLDSPKGPYDQRLPTSATSLIPPAVVEAESNNIPSVSDGIADAAFATPQVAVKTFETAEGRSPTPSTDDNSFSEGFVRNARERRGGTGSRWRTRSRD